jgi:hypothetical protein
MSVFFGSRQRYREHFDAHPGTYFLTSGWIERGVNGSDLSQLSIARRSGMEMSYDEMVEKYGADNAAYLYETLHTKRAAHYGTYAFIEMGVEPDGRFRAEAERRAVERGWTFTRVAGDMGIIQRLIEGPWDGGDVLCVPPGRAIAPTYDDDVVQASEV